MISDMDIYKFNNIFTWIIGFIIHIMATSILLEISATSATTWNDPNGEEPDQFGRNRRNHNRRGDAGGEGRGGERKGGRSQKHFLPFYSPLYPNNQSSEEHYSVNLLRRGRGRKGWHENGGDGSGGGGGGGRVKGERGRRGKGRYRKKAYEEEGGGYRVGVGGRGYKRKENYEDYDLYEYANEDGEGVGWYQGSEVEDEGDDDPQVRFFNGPPPDGPPRFDLTLNKNVTAMMGNAAYLHCIVHDLYNYTVSWIRESDLHILTVAQYTYTADQRFECVHRHLTNEWILKVKYTQPRDTDRYECQVNTKPTIGFMVNLHVIVPSARVLGKPERYLDMGSTINLTCIITYSPEPPAYIFWYFNNKVLQYDESDSRISIITDRGEVTRTYLLIHDAKSSDSGTYTCAPSSASPASVIVHVLNAGRSQPPTVPSVAKTFSHMVSWLRLQPQCPVISRIKGESTAAMQMNSVPHSTMPSVTTSALVAIVILNAVMVGQW
ncbi:uncharacterized protein LOC143024617 isoform X2 [Oratosquilla oratoria]|uniref:uncharacterized protein LOC143024617 isoform X2 n=1 Tax=Oratosquilla oratoria TaxID=337810 RepID=UPI003F76A1CA